MGGPGNPQPSAAQETWLVQQHRGVLVRYFQRRGASQANAEDLAQECFARLFALGNKEHILNVEAYLFQIAASVFADHLRRGRVREDGAHVPLHEAPPVPEVLTPARVLEGRETIARVVAALAQLGPRTREIFLLNRMDGLSYTQIAVRFAISPSAVEKHMMKALAHLHKNLKATNVE